jgi:DNA-binding CsgD family transcriptional regulator
MAIIEEISEQEQVASKKMAWAIVESSPFLTLLTKHQKQVALLIARGYSNEQASIILGVSPRTVESHYENIRGRIEPLIGQVIDSRVHFLSLLFGIAQYSFNENGIQELSMQKEISEMISQGLSRRQIRQKVGRFSRAIVNRIQSVN